ncbi:nucleoside triphosphate pyrophosphohydrolase [Pontivivens ytuae]|uniref:Nucleoside triphosphate pyrophosphohydrolase n=1 Tax=Pontivivens ytuae TaxID=2789856 RepID=A0A7S9LR69_9RHOB|nr:nucleoside triphosphate pyrophosphohydrolase [Pontivivens ytuae]QPH53712.1 nucleoside triphosphate pyrophosphohydrolase [Pontivivens ytuae]
MTKPLDRSASDALVHDGGAGLERLVEIMARLRAPDGCPWDREQDFASIAPYTIEEAYEVADAIARQDMADLRDELGDLLLQVVYHAQMAGESGDFALADVIRSISDKMVRRHPHVFGSAAGRTADEQIVDWERIKAEERAAKGKTRERVLDGVAMGLPALTRAVKLQNRAARVGFDWPQTEQVLDKIVEESRELVEARETLPHAKQVEEFGDLMFVMANLARHLGIDPEEALRDANAKFTRRFNAVEDALATKGKRPDQSDLSEMDALWDAAKASESASG